MKLRKLLLYVCAFIGITAHAQEDMLNVTRIKQEAAPQQNGMGSAVFKAKTADFVIRTSDNEYECSQAKKVADGYEYEMQIDVSKGKVRVFIVSKKGLPISGKTSQVIINRNEKSFFSIEQPDDILGKTKEEINSKQYFAKGKNPTEALIEINSSIKLDVSYSNAIGMRHIPVLKNGTYIDSLIFEVPKLIQLRHRADSLQKAYQKLNDSANNSWTDAQWQALDKLENEANEAAEISNGAAVITLQGKGTNRLTINEDLVRKLTPKDKLTYGIMLMGKTDTVIKTILKEAAFDDLLKIAKEYMANYPAHTESSYYDAAKIAYNNAINHNDCPYSMRDSLRKEYDMMADLRKNSYYVEAAEAKANQFEKEKGFDCDEVFKYLGGEIGFIDRILKAHPEISGFNALKSIVASRLQRHPKSKVKDGEEVVMRQRETISGRVSFKNQYMAVPFESMRIYATTSSKIKNGQSRIIGKVKSDGTYSVVKPDGMSPLYIYTSGEKDDAHYVPSGSQTIDIIVK